MQRVEVGNVKVLSRERDERRRNELAETEGETQTHLSTLRGVMRGFSLVWGTG